VIRSCRGRLEGLGRRIEMRRWIRYAAGLALVTPFMVVAGVVPARAGGGFCHDAPVTDTSTDRVVISNYCFGPTIARVGVGDGVTWLNKDGTPHAVAGANASWASDGELQTGDRTTIRFAKAGIYPYLCSLHPGMIGAVVVGDGEAAAASQAGVPVALPDVPSTGEAVAPAANDEGIREVASFPWKVGTVVGFSLFMLMVVAVGFSRRSASRITADPNVESSLS
jgi:plastocyanin